MVRVLIIKQTLVCKTRLRQSPIVSKKHPCIDIEIGNGFDLRTAPKNVSNDWI